MTFSTKPFFLDAGFRYSNLVQVLGGRNDLERQCGEGSFGAKLGVRCQRRDLWVLKIGSKQIPRIGIRIECLIVLEEKPLLAIEFQSTLRL